MKVRLISLVTTAHNSENLHSTSSATFLSQDCLCHGSASGSTGDTRDFQSISTAATVPMQPNTHWMSLIRNDWLNSLKPICITPRKRISIFINLRVHVCSLVCISMCTAWRVSWLPTDVIIFHLQALISAWVPRHFLLFCLCYFVRACTRWWVCGAGRGSVHPCVCVLMCGSLPREFLSLEKLNFHALSG